MFDCSNSCSLLNCCLLRHAIIRHFSRGNQRIREDIPAPDSLRKEATFIGVCRGCLKCHRVLVSAASNL